VVDVAAAPVEPVVVVKEMKEKSTARPARPARPAKAARPAKPAKTARPKTKPARPRKRPAADPGGTPDGELATKILRLLADNQGATDNSGAAIQISDASLTTTFGIAKGQANKALRELIESGKIVAKGSGREAWYELVANEAPEPAEPAPKPRKSRAKGPSQAAIEKLVSDGLATRLAAEAEPTEPDEPTRESD
jgi:hypothetical protein